MRAAAIEAATELFGTAGYRGATFKDVAAKLGMTAAGLTYYFPDKDALLAAVLQERDRPALVAETAIPPSPSRADITDHVMRILAENIEHPGLAELHCVLSAEATSAEHPAHEHFRDRYRKARELLTDAFEVAIARGEIRPSIPPRTLATLLLGVLDGVQLQWLLDPQEVDMQATVHTFVSDLLAPPESP
ncbi:TetR/AcrR family transcriptional regulator [Nonomuraea jabiensis]|uniref:AcrR family transcriptional regulator n=1 Tax=Nonomuraea jabiensis TaxID=882448 RepID=A0A7W9LGU4_9ACTN|nr:TetR/AcrR family transcriptional regulator [Nonomuraea jabiensis]MBB5783326.1 AcrR family transcriptional regulator [Nonomuraea jabiensis]